MMSNAEGKLIFVECKAPGKKATGAQEREIKRLKDRGQLVRVIDSKKGVDDLLEDYV